MRFGGRGELLGLFRLIVSRRQAWLVAGPRSCRPCQCPRSAGCTHSTRSAPRQRRAETASRSFRNPPPWLQWVICVHRRSLQISLSRCLCVFVGSELFLGKEELKHLHVNRDVLFQLSVQRHGQHYACEKRCDLALCAETLSVLCI